MTADAEGFEPWARVAFGLGGATLALYLYLGLRPGGAGPVLAYRYGPLVLGGAAALLLLGAIAWSLYRRPALRRRRAVPLAVLAACVWWCSFPLAYPSSHAGHPSRVSLSLPFAGERRVRFGGEQRARNPLLLDPSRRFAVTFDPPLEGESGVLAPAGGRVVARETDERAGHARLVIAVAPGEYLVLEGLDPAALTHDEGAELARGAPLGRSIGPLCVFLQDGERIGRSEGVPFAFTEYLADGRAIRSGSPVPPERVRNAAAAGER